MAAYFLKQGFTKILSLNRVIFALQKCISSRPSEIVDSAMRDIPIPDITIPEFVFQNFSAWPDKTAVECSVTGKKFTFEEIRKKSINLGKALRDVLKLKEGDVIAILLPNVPEYPICVLGALQAGLIVTTINPMYMPYEIKRQLAEIDAKAIITINPLWIVTQVAIKLIPSDIPVLTIKAKNGEQSPLGAINFEELINVERDTKEAFPRNATDVALIPYSCGTIDLPKGVELTHRNIVANLCQINVPYLRSAEDTTDTFQDVVLDVVPWSHIYGLTSVLFSHLYNMCKIVSLPTFLPDQFVNALAKYKPSLLHVSRAIVMFMTNYSMVKREFLKPLRNMTTVKFCLKPETEEAFLDKADKYIGMLHVYGLTEASSCVFMTSPIAKKICDIIGSVGEMPPSTLVKIVPTGTVGAKPCGELLIRGPQVMKGYHNRPEETKAAFVDGWLRTQDLAYYDYNKMFYIRDRQSEMISVEGFKVAPLELEEIMRSHPDIVDAAVIGVPHTIYGQVPRAYVVAKPGAMLDKDKIVAFVDDQVASYKNISGGIVIVRSIPTNAFGDVIKRYLKLQYEEKGNF